MSAWSEPGNEDWQFACHQTAQGYPMQQIGEERLSQSADRSERPSITCSLLKEQAIAFKNRATHVIQSVRIVPKKGISRILSP